MRNLEPLSDYEFELLVADLLSAELSLRFEVFARGADGGIDVRAMTDDTLHVAQCKHYVHTTFAALERAAEKEREKLGSLDPRPDEYWFVTSRRLTVHQKTRLQAALRPWIRRKDHVLGAGDLELLLNRHERVERAHVKLWLASGAALESMLRAGTIARTKGLLEQVRETLPRYVQNAGFARAQKLLNETGVCLIAGEPGIGKTTLAQMLLLDSANAGYEPVAISEDAEQGLEMLKDDQAQVFYYDDFLGRTSIDEPLRKNEDVRLIDLITRATRLKDRTRLILTTREYILRGASQLYESFRRADLDHRRFLLTLDDYTRFERALILYNHVRHSGQLTPDAVGGLLKDRTYAAIIDHPNYNPRLVEFITGLMGPRRLEPAELQDWSGFAKRALDHPQEIWEHAFEAELTPEQQALLLVLVTFGSRAEFEDLRTAFTRHCSETEISLRRQSFERSLRRLEGTFLNVRRERGHDFVRFSNPSVEDFLTGELLRNPSDVRDLLRGANFFGQIRRLWNLGRRPDSSAEYGSVMANAFSPAQDELAAALERTLHVPGGVWMEALSAAGGTGYVRVAPSFESRIALIATVRALSRRAAARLAHSFHEALRELGERWSRADGDKRAAIGLLRRLDDDGYREAIETLLPVLKAWIMDDLHDADDYDRADDLRRAFPDVYSIREWADLQDNFAGWAEHELEWSDPGEEEIDAIERVAEAMGVSRIDSELEDARINLEQSRAEEAEYIDVDEARQAFMEDRAEDEVSDPDDDADIDALFARLEDEL